jgi:tetratricopeptide (TPR) repeat protein
MATLLLAGCAGHMNVLPEKDLMGYPVKKVMEFGAENYSYYNYNEALYYYSEVDRIFTNDTPENTDSRAWANYEIGFINYIQGKYDDADKYFDKVLTFKLLNQGPLILANEMKDKIKAKKK